MTKQELLEMIKTVLEANPGADIVRMSRRNAEKLGMPVKVCGRDVAVMDEGFPDNCILTGGHSTCCG